MLTPRRLGLKTFGLALASVGLSAAAMAAPGAGAAMTATGGGTLAALTKRLAAAPRRRDFKTVPMILNNRDQWDAEALDAVLHYPGGPKHCWDNTDLVGPWLNLMRNTMNTEVFSFRRPAFLCVSATHGSAQLALYDDAMWEKYGFARIAGAGVTNNRFVAAPAGLNPDPKDYENTSGAYSSAGNSIQMLQRRGAVFLACHNAVWELSERLIKSGANPDKLAIEAMCAELSNHLIPDVVLTPGAVGTVVELEKAGFSYAR